MDTRSSIVYPHGRGWKGKVSKFACKSRFLLFLLSLTFRLKTVINLFGQSTARHLNFYRIHLLCFTFIPLIASGIFYASNGPSPQNQIAYIDCLFLCFSAMTVCGLTTALFANLTVWQQVILFFLMTTGSISFVSIMTILVRRHYFQKRFKYLIENNAQIRDRLNSVGMREAQHRHRLNGDANRMEGTAYSSTLRGSGAGTAIEDEASRWESVKRKQKKKLEKLRADMIRRVDEPVRVNEMNISGRIGGEATPDPVAAQEERPASLERSEQVGTQQHISIAEPTLPHDRRIPRTVTVDVPRLGRNDEDLRLRRNRTTALDYPTRRPSRSGLRDINSRTLTRTATIQASSQPAINENFGGFQNPLKVVAGFAISRIPPLRRTQDPMPRTSTLVSTRSRRPSIESVGAPRMSKLVSYLSFDATVGRNSRFHHLTSEQQAELGGVEYRALSLLLKIVFGYWIGIQLIGVLTIAPWLTYSNKYKSIFEATSPPINPTFFSFFQVFSGLSNTGMSLVDASMVPFNNAYWLILLVAFLILAGNTALPVFLRLTIWTFSKLVPRDSRIKETLSFLLDHPRRTYIYLFPAHQTWQLVFVLICLNAIDWIAFVVLDIGNPQIDALSPGVRCINGLFQAIAVRTAGFSIVSLATVAPALQFLFVIMQYVSAYPIAISVRATNTYEDQAVGVQEQEEEEEEIEENSRPSSAYILFHVRRQLAFDIWFLCGALFILCIIERHRITSADWSEVNIFSLLFETVSAYGTVGLSLGNNRNATSLSGVLSTGSKLVLIAVMLRGRHRGLPVAIDRSILLPFDLNSRERTLSVHSQPTIPITDDLLPRSMTRPSESPAFTSEPVSMDPSTSTSGANATSSLQPQESVSELDVEKGKSTTSSSSSEHEKSKEA
ncbi:hypothetical protein JCM3765_005678 [Sporobolomyces pararoseus]